jgi:diguanylate cyclase (GGDEF)-like protein/PAS domain S-box-containing protein
MFSLDPELAALALGDARLATWEWIVASDEFRWTSGHSEIYSYPVGGTKPSLDWVSVVHPSDRRRVRQAALRAVEYDAGFREQFRVQGADGKYLWILSYAQVLRDPGQPVRMIGLNLDVTDWVSRLAAAETRFTATFEQAAVGIAHVGIDGKWLNVNRRCCEIVGYTKDELLQLTFGEITHPDDLDGDWALVRALLRGERDTYSIEKRYYTRSMQLVWANLTVSLVRDADGAPDYFISVIEDITARKQLEVERNESIHALEERVRERTVELEKLSMTDALTGVANRRRLEQHLADEWDRAVRTRQSLSVVLIDIDFFKGLNDSLGHAAADHGLVSVARQLSRLAQRSGDLVARYGGDEFFMVLPETDSGGASNLAAQIKESVDALAIENPGSSNAPTLTVSQGVATAVPTKKGCWSSLMLHADRALYSAKRTGRNRIAVAGSPETGDGNIDRASDSTA